MLLVLDLIVLIALHHVLFWSLSIHCLLLLQVLQLSLMFFKSALDYRLLDERSLIWIWELGCESGTVIGLLIGELRMLTLLVGLVLVETLVVLWPLLIGLLIHLIEIFLPHVTLC
jgi:hypothetical protein